MVWGRYEEELEKNKPKCWFDENRFSLNGSKTGLMLLGNWENYINPEMEIYMVLIKVFENDFSTNFVEKMCAIRS